MFIIKVLLQALAIATLAIAAFARLTDRHFPALSCVMNSDCPEGSLCASFGPGDDFHCVEERFLDMKPVLDPPEEI